jgi:hypothetical protein
MVPAYPARWTELRGQIVAKILFRAKLVEGRTMRVLWQMDFPGEEILKSGDFLKQAHEAALSKALHPQLIRAGGPRSVSRH